MSTPDSVIPRPGYKVSNSVWLDVNTQLGIVSQPDLVPNIQAINNSLFNLFSCPIGARGPIFQPEYGTALLQLLHDPLDLFTAQKLRLFVIQAIQRWEPRVEVDMASSTVMPVPSLPGYYVKVAYKLLSSGERGDGIFQFSL